MKLENYHQFNSVVTTVLKALAKSFPAPVDLDFQELGLADGPAFEQQNLDEVKTAHAPQHIFASQCVAFLVDEGFIIGTPHYVWVQRARLTTKGLELIGASLSSLEKATYI